MEMESPDPALQAEVNENLTSLSIEIDRLEFQLVMDEERDAANAILSVNAGAGGVESQDWAEMLLRLYARWAEGRGFSTRIVSMLSGEEAGIKNVVLIIQGEYVYGYLRS